MLKRFAEWLVPGAENTPGRPEICYQLATCVVLLEAARIDNEFTGEERGQIIQSMRAQFGLTQDEAEELLELAMAEHDQTNDLWRFTNQINQSFSVPDKLTLMEHVWRLIFSDGFLDGHEDHLAHKLRALLNLNHPQMIEAKMKVLNEIRNSA